MGGRDRAAVRREGYYEAHRRRALERAAAWEPDEIRAGVEAFFRRIGGK